MFLLPISTSANITQGIVVFVALSIISIASIVVLSILLKRQRAELSDKLREHSDKYRWLVVQEPPSSVKEVLTEVEFRDYCPSYTHSPIVVSDDNGPAYLMVFGYTIPSLARSVLDQRVLGIAIFKSDYFPAIDLDASQIPLHLFTVRRHVVQIHGDWSKNWHITTDDEIAATEFLMGQYGKMFSTFKHVTNIAVKQKYIVCAGERSDDIHSYIKVYEELKLFTEHVVNDGLGLKKTGNGVGGRFK